MRRAGVGMRVAALAAAGLLWCGRASAQVTPAAGYTPPDDTPTVRVGGVLFLDYTNTQDPEITDADGNKISQSAFNVGRAYINVTGQLNHLFAFRITPDIMASGGGVGGDGGGGIGTLLLLNLFRDQMAKTTEKAPTNGHS